MVKQSEEAAADVGGYTMGIQSEEAAADVGGYTLGIQSEVSSAAELTASEAGGGDSHAWFEKKGTRLYTKAWVHG
jgi:hypothetical protein